MLGSTLLVTDRSEQNKYRLRVKCRVSTLDVFILPAGRLRLGTWLSARSHFRGTCPAATAVSNSFPTCLFSWACCIWTFWIGLPTFGTFHCFGFQTLPTGKEKTPVFFHSVSLCCHIRQTALLMCSYVLTQRRHSTILTTGNPELGRETANACFKKDDSKEDLLKK